MKGQGRSPERGKVGGVGITSCKRKARVSSHKKGGIHISEILHFPYNVNKYYTFYLYIQIIDSRLVEFLPLSVQLLALINLKLQIN